MTMTRIPFETMMRAAAVQMLRDYAQDASYKLSVYEGRPLTIAPPHAWVERLRETIGEGNNFSAFRQRQVEVDVRIVWGLFDSKEAVLQRDTFIDQFIDWTWDRPHEAFGSTVLEPRRVEDDPNFQPDWGPEQQRNADYFSSLLTIGGFAGGY